MVDYIVISTAITIIEALEICNCKKFKEPKCWTAGMITNEFGIWGIKEVSVWANLKKVFTEPFTNQNSVLSATINVGSFMKTGNRNYTTVIEKIESYLPDNFTRKGDLNWKVKNASFIYNFQGYHIRDYFQLIRNGYGLENINLSKSVEKIKGDSQECCRITYSGMGAKTREKKLDNPKIQEQGNADEYASFALPVTKKIGKKQKKKQLREYQESIGIEVTLNYNKRFDGPDIQYLFEHLDKDYLQVKINAKKKKTIQLCRAYGIYNRNVNQFMENIEKIDAYLFHQYMERITGTGDYYRYVDAEQKIMESNYAKGEREKMFSALKGIAQYKGVANFLSHVEDENPTYECMKIFRQNKQYAQVALRNLNSLGINPMNLSLRSRVKENLPNLIQVYSQQNIKDFEPPVQNVLKKVNVEEYQELPF